MQLASVGVSVESMMIVNGRLEGGGSVDGAVGGLKRARDSPRRKGWVRVGLLWVCGEGECRGNWAVVIPLRGETLALRSDTRCRAISIFIEFI